MTQTGTNAPVATVLENTLEGTPVWSYLAEESPGSYKITLNNAFIGRSFLAIGSTYLVERIEYQTIDNNASAINVTDDGLLNKTPIEIRVYN